MPDFGGGSKSSTKYKASGSEKLLRPFIVERATDPNITDSSTLARGMRTEALGRLFKPSQMDPRTAGILTSLMSGQGLGGGQGFASLMEQFRGAPSASPIGIRPYGSPAMSEARNATPARGGQASRIFEALLGSSPDQDFQDRTQAASDRISGRTMKGVEGETTVGEDNRKAMQEFLPTAVKGKGAKQRYWDAIFAD